MLAGVQFTLWFLLVPSHGPALCPVVPHSPIPSLCVSKWLSSLSCLLPSFLLVFLSFLSGFISYVLSLGIVCSGHCRWHCGWGRTRNLWPDGQGGGSYLHVVLAVQALKCMQWPLVPALQRVISPWAPFVGLTHTIELASISCSSMGA